MSVLYCYYRWHVYYEDKEKDLDSAIARAAVDIGDNLAAPVKFVLEDGAELDRDEITSKAWEYADKGDENG